jgi:Protein of unknown function (DUF3237)
MFDYCLDHLFSFTATLTSPEVIGPISEGIRANSYITGGEVGGANMQGKFRPVGGDWFTLRKDGVAILDVRATIETHDGALIYASYSGVGDLGENGYDKFLKGELPKTLPLRIAPRFQTAHPAYAWLNRLQCLGIGEVNLEHSNASYDVYALR